MNVTPKREKRGIKVESKSGIGSDFGPSLFPFRSLFVSNLNRQEFSLGFFSAQLVFYTSIDFNRLSNGSY